MFSDLFVTVLARSALAFTLLQHTSNRFIDLSTRTMCLILKPHWHILSSHLNSFFHWPLHASTYLEAQSKHSIWSTSEFKFALQLLKSNLGLQKAVEKIVTHKYNEINVQNWIFSAFKTKKNGNRDVTLDFSVVLSPHVVRMPNALIRRLPMISDRSEGEAVRAYHSAVVWQRVPSTALSAERRERGSTARLGTEQSEPPRGSRGEGIVSATYQAFGFFSTVSRHQ